jgi:hypothetical protein
MNTAPDKYDPQATDGAPPAGSVGESRAWHRIAEVRLQQGLSDKVLAKRLAMKPREIERQQSPDCDLMLSQLYKWQAALDVPVSELLVDPGQALSPGVGRRAQLVKLMKTVRSLQQVANSAPLRALAVHLGDQLVEIMPELEHISSWPIVGQLRTPRDISPLEERLLPDPFPYWTRLPSVDND